MSDTTSAIDLRSVGYTYPSGVEALRSVSLTVGEGEIVSVVGPSGCGKSTLLNITAGLLRAGSGSVSLNGHDTGNRLGQLSFMPQQDLLLPWRSALDNASLLLEVRGAGRAEARERAAGMLERFGLAPFAGFRPDQLSGGMRQRVALVRTFLPDCDVLLDEPFGALDAITRSDLQIWLLELQAATRRSVLLVTHDLEEAIFLSDRVYLMSPRPGRIIRDVGVDLPKPRPAEVTAAPAFVTLKAGLLKTLRDTMVVEDQAA